MRLIGVISTAVLSLAIAAPAYAQQEQHEQEGQKEKPAQEQEKKAQPEKPAKQEKSAQQEKNTNQEGKNAQQENKNTKQEEKNAQQQEKNGKQEEKNAQQRTPEAQPEKQAQRGGGGRIPDARYKANFGREHTFRVSQGDFSSGRFQYGGYWFGFGGAWPSNWLYTQDVYVIEIDGVYYLCNAMYPGVNLELNVTL